MRGSIWKVNGFLPYIIVVFLNAFTDLGHKIIIQNTIFKIYDAQTQIILTAIVNALILLPFIMLFSPSGFMSDRYPKSSIMRVLAAAAVVITLLITLCYYLGLFELAFGLTFLLAMQSAIYSPAKYGYIKELVGDRLISMGNGVVQATTTVSILGGILVYSIFFESYLDGVTYKNSSDILQHIAPIGWLLVAGSLIEFWLAFRLPNTHIENRREFHLSRYYKGIYLKENLSLLFKDRVILLSIVGLSLFWGISQVVLSSFPEYAKNTIGITNTVLVQGMMAIAGIGIVIGSIIAGRVSRNYIEVGTVPVGAIGITISLSLLPVAVEPIWHMANFFIFGLSAGLLIVPLNALIQYRSPKHDLGMILAGNNFLQNIVMFSFLMMTVAFALWGIQSVGLFYIMLIFSVMATFLLIKKSPQELLRFVLLVITSTKYRVKIINTENLPKQGAVLLLGNHISWIDWIFVQMATPRPIRFVMDRTVYRRWYLKPFFELFGAIPISPRAMKQAKIDVERLLQEGEVVCLFPEGAISHNGHLGEFKRGFEKMVGDSSGVIVPFYLQGLWGDRLSRASSHLKKQIYQRRSRVIVNFGKPIPTNSKASTIKSKINELSYQAWLEYTATLPTLAEGWIDIAKRCGRSKCCEEFNGKQYNYIEMLSDSILYSKKITDDKGARVGLMLPPSIDAVKMILALLMASREFLPLDEKLTKEMFDQVVSMSEIETIYTTRRYLNSLKASGIDIDRLLESCQLVYLDDIAKGISRFDRWLTKISVVVLPKMVLKAIYAPQRKNQDIAIDMMSRSRSKRAKIAMLTDRNIMANTIQLRDMLNIDEDDLMLSTLPLHHAYGLITTILSPLLMGLPVGFSSDPRNAKAIGRAVLRYKATILPSIPSLLDLYGQNKALDPLMFGSLRIVLSGGDKLDSAISNRFKEKFYKQILEGYGTTESAPVASTNIANIMESVEFMTHIGHKSGTVGMPLQGTAFRIVDPVTLEPLDFGEEGLVLIGGAQVMSGYLNDQKLTDEVVIVIDGLRWFKSGDMGSLDSDGFLRIVQMKELL